jgi:hypothetical protein
MELNRTVEMLEHPEKAQLPAEIRDSGISNTPVSPVQFRKA